MWALSSSHIYIFLLWDTIFFCWELEPGLVTGPGFVELSDRRLAWMQPFRTTASLALLLDFFGAVDPSTLRIAPDHIHIHKYICVCMHVCAGGKQRHRMRECEREKKSDRLGDIFLCIVPQGAGGACKLEQRRWQQYPTSLAWAWWQVGSSSSYICRFEYTYTKRLSQ